MMPIDTLAGNVDCGRPDTYLSSGKHDEVASR